MINLNEKIERMLDDRAKKYGIMGTEQNIITLNLTDDEKDEFYNLDLSDNFSWNIEGNELTIIYVEDLEMQENLEEYWYVFDSKQFQLITYNNKNIYQIDEARIDYDSESNSDIYRAKGIDKEGCLYDIQWEILDEYLDDDGNFTEVGAEAAEDMLCDWDNPKYIKNETLNLWL